jgi:hypothetical protein
MVDFPFTVIPTVGFEFARFGEPRSQHRRELGAFRSWQRDPESSKQTDLYLDTLMSLDYDNQDQLEYIEIINPEAVVYVEGVDFVNRPLDEVLEAMARNGNHVAGPHVGTYAYPELGIRFGVRPDDETGDEIIEGCGLVEKETLLNWASPLCNGNP